MRQGLGRLTAAAAVALAGLLVASSVPGPVAATDLAASATHAAPAVQENRVDPASLPSLQAHLLPSQSVGFAVTGDDNLRRFLDGAISDAASGGRLVEVYPIASSPQLIGFRLRSSTLASVPTGTQTFWYSLDQRQVIPPQALLADGATTPGGVSFTPAGEVYLESVVNSTTQAEEADPARLSDLGRAAQSAAVSPTDPVQPAEPRQVDCSVQRCIALTFDDGPSDYTPSLLKTLAENDALATFYILGRNLAGREETLRAMAAAGHQIGNHTVNHPRMSEQPQTMIVSEIIGARDALAPYPKNGSETFRPPYGLYNNTVLAAAAAAGYSVTMWSIDPSDYRTKDPAIVVERVLAQARPGAVVLSHDTLEHSEVAYRTIIPELRKAGYELVTVDQLLGTAAPGQVRRGS